MAEDERAGILDRQAIIGLKSYWRVKLYDWTSGDLDYIGCHDQPLALITDENWAVWKLTWSGGNVTQIEGPLTGTYNGRATLDWRP